jgi:DNA repair ATPase RecN
LFFVGKGTYMQIKESLWSLQDRLLELEEEINSDDTELELLLGDISKKVDDIKYVIDIFESESERFKKYKDDMDNRQKSLQKAADRLKGYTIKCLEAHGSTFEKGTVWVAKIREYKKVDTYLAKPTTNDLLAIGMKHNIFRTVYDWDKTELKKLLSDENHDPDLDSYAKIVTTKSLNFSAVNAASKQKEKEVNA